MHAFDTVGRFFPSFFHFKSICARISHLTCFFFYSLRNCEYIFIVFSSNCVFVIFSLNLWNKKKSCFIFDIIYLVGQTNDIRFFIVVTIYIKKPPHYLVSLFVMRETPNAPYPQFTKFLYLCFIGTLKSCVFFTSFSTSFSSYNSLRTNDNII